LGVRRSGSQSLRVSLASGGDAASPRPRGETLPPRGLGGRRCLPEASGETLPPRGLGGRRCLPEASGGDAASPRSRGEGSCRRRRSPDLLVGDGEGPAERLRRVEPDGRVLLGRRRRLARDRRGAHVQGAGDGRQQRVGAGVRTEACREREVRGQRSEVGTGAPGRFRPVMETHPAGLWAGPWSAGLPP